MNKAEFIFLLQNPESIDSFKTQKLDEVINEFPYFQAARAIQLNGLNKTKSFKYNQALKKTAAYTIDRKVLFEFITSPTFINRLNKNSDILEEIEVIEPETITILTEETENVITENIEAEDVLEIGSPIHFNSSEAHSFNEWMQLISKKPIIRTEEEENPEEKLSDNNKKFSLIDKFIKSNPKIKPVDKTTTSTDISLESTNENDSLMTETLAKVYLEQKKYDNAIKAYRILSLKYPEKSGFFADRIKAIKVLQNNKS